MNGRSTAAMLVAISLGCVSLDARADVEACVAAHTNGQTERNAGHLQQAKAAFSSCASPSCPTEVQSDCNQFLLDLDRLIASVVFSAVDSEGHDTLEVKVAVDGLPVLDKLSGLSTELDPGSHLVTFTWPDGVEQQQNIVIAQGEKSRRIELRRARTVPKAEAPLAAVDPRAKASKPPTMALVLGGVGVLALGGFAAFAVAGRSAEHEMAGCKPHCRQSQLDKMNLRYLLADISLGVAAVSLGTGGYLYFSAASKPSSTALGGANLTWRGTF